MKLTQTTDIRHSTFAFRSMGRGLTMVSVLLAVTLGLAATAVAQPCASLPEDKLGEYVNLGKTAVQAYADGDFETSIGLNRQALAICDEDPVVAYNMARAYHKNGDCLMALHVYTELPLAEMPDKQSKVDGYVGELAGQCGDSGTVRVQCADDGVSLAIAGRVATCPWEGRLPSGTAEIGAGLGDEYLGHVEVVDVTKDGDVSVSIPALKRKDQFGSLDVSCADGVAKFTLSGPLGDQELDCPYNGMVEVGNYTLRTEREGKPESVTVVAQQETRVDKLSTPAGGCACTVRATSDSAPAGQMALFGLLALGLVGFRRRSRRRLR